MRRIAGAFLLIFSFVVMTGSIAAQQGTCEAWIGKLLDELAAKHQTVCARSAEGDPYAFEMQVALYMKRVPAAALPQMVERVRGGAWMVRYIENVACNKIRGVDGWVYSYDAPMDEASRLKTYEMVKAWFETARRSAAQSFTEDYAGWKKGKGAAAETGVLRMDGVLTGDDLYDKYGVYIMVAVDRMLGQGVRDFSLCEVANAVMMRGVSRYWDSLAPLEDIVKTVPSGKAEEKERCERLMKWMKENRRYWDPETCVEDQPPRG